MPTVGTGLAVAALLAETWPPKHRGHPHGYFRPPWVQVHSDPSRPVRRGGKYGLPEKKGRRCGRDVLPLLPPNPRTAGCAAPGKTKEKFFRASGAGRHHTETARSHRGYKCRPGPAPSGATVSGPRVARRVPGAFRCRKSAPFPPAFHRQPVFRNGFPSPYRHGDSFIFT